MYTPGDVSFKIAHTGFRALIRTASLASAVTTLALVATDFGSNQAGVGAVDGSSCAAAFDPSARYPQLPETMGADVGGEAGIVIHLQHHRGVVEIDDCLYQLDRPLEIEFGGLDAVGLLLEIHDDVTASSELFVTSAGTVEMHSVNGAFTVFTLTPQTAELGFELAAPGQAAPTVPVVIAKPVDDGPPPS